MCAVQGRLRDPVRRLRPVSRLPDEKPVVLLPSEGEGLQPGSFGSHFPTELTELQCCRPDSPGADHAAHRDAAAHLEEADRADGLHHTAGQAGPLGEDDQAGRGEGAGRENAQKVICYKI